MAEISYKPIEPIFGQDFSNRFESWLFNKFFAGEDWGESLAYPGALFPNVSQTRLPDVWNSWQPWDGGTSYIADYMANNRGGIGTASPYTSQILKYGGAGGPGNQAMSLQMQYGAPSQAGQYMANLAQHGVASQGSGQYLQALAAGSPQFGAQYLTPFTQFQGGGYRAPAVQQRQVTRRPMAMGGIVTQPTNALIGERGPEAVVPLNNPFNLAAMAPLMANNPNPYASLNGYPYGFQVDEDLPNPWLLALQNSPIGGSLLGTALMGLLGKKKRKTTVTPLQKPEGAK